MAEMHKLFPPDYQEVPDTELLVFLAGPIQGAPDWQADATNMIERCVSPSSLYIANPRRAVFQHEGFDYQGQVDWEKAHLRRATRHGAALFWFAAETPDAPAPNKPGRQYAKTTIKELHRAIGWRDYDSHIRLSVGIDPDFDERLRYDQLCLEEIGVPVHETLEDTIADALKSIGVKAYGTV